VLINIKKISFLKNIFVILMLTGICQLPVRWIGAVVLQTECRLYIEQAGPNFKKIDINKATEEDLDALPGIGKKTARAIVAYRDSIGGYKSLEQLQRVRGVEEKVYNCLIQLVTIGDSP
jgi:competence ComEA-like helix-hairpin-helix protein